MRKLFDMKLLICFLSLIQSYRYVCPEIRTSAIMNKLVKPVGGSISKKFVPLTELPPPHHPHEESGRRHLEPDYQKNAAGKEVFEGPQVAIFGDYYDDRVAKTVATVIIPDHIDTKHFEVTTQVPYLTVGNIEAIGYHPSIPEGPNECEKIYLDQFNDQYSGESSDFSDESMEVARMPLWPGGLPNTADQPYLETMYGDLQK